MLVSDSVSGQSYNLSDLDRGDTVRICYTGPYGDRNSLLCYAPEVKKFRGKLKDRGCSIDSLQLSH